MEPKELYLLSVLFLEYFNTNKRMGLLIVVWLVQIVSSQKQVEKFM
jgi:hypothetical protein